MKRLFTLLLVFVLLISTLPVCAFAETDGELPPADPFAALPFTIGHPDLLAQYEAESKTVLLYLPDDLKKIDLALTFKPGFTGKIYADPTFSQAVKVDKNGIFSLKLSQMYTYLYLRCNKNSGTYRLQVISKRTPINYRDDHLVADWAKLYVNFCNELGYGIIQGDENRNANPEQSLTRYEIALIAARMLGTDVSHFSKTEMPYKDKIVSWAQQGVGAMSALGIINGHKMGGKLQYLGDDNVTREQVAKIMVELALRQEGSKKTAKQLYLKNKTEYEKILRTFADEKSVSDWARPYVALAVCHFKFISGSKSGDTLYLNPTKNITRQEMTVMAAKELNYSIDALLDDLVERVDELLQSTDKSEDMLTEVKSALTKAQRVAENGSNKKKEKAYIALYTEYKAVFQTYIVYLSPSNQMTNPYTGVDTNEGAQMQKVADLLKPMLEEMGFIVYIADPKSNIRVRGEDAKKKNADIYVAIHSNAVSGTNDGSGQGSIIFHSDISGSRELAMSVSKYLSKLTPTADEGIKDDSKAEIPYVEIRDPVMANILAEVEYHDYPTYAKWIVKNRKKIAKAFANGIWDYFYN